MNPSPLLREESVPGGARRVVLRAQAVAVPVAEPAPAGMWITEQELAAMQRQWTEQARKQGWHEAQQAARQDAEVDALARMGRELKARDEKYAREQAEKWHGVASALTNQLESLRSRLEAEVSEWSFVAVTRLLGKRSREEVAAAVQHVLAEAQLDGPVTVLLHAQDVAIVEGARAAAPGSWPADLRFAASNKLPLGGCLVESTAQALDARLEVQLGLLREAMTLAHHQREDESRS